MSLGILALQGDFALHDAAFDRLGVDARQVRTAAEIAELDALVLPGGESSAMLKLMAGTGVAAAIGEFHKRGGAILGTCAGLILMAHRVTGPSQESLHLLDVDVARNGYGRQAESFETDLPWPGSETPFRGVFIRAPRITRVGGAVEIVLQYLDEPVAVRDGRVLGVTFHPESTDDPRVHEWFLEQVVGQTESAQ